MDRVRAFVRRHFLWAALLGVLLPLGVLLLFQYQWLERLESVSTIAHRAALDNYLETLGNEVRFFYTSTAERALNLSPRVFEDGCRQAMANHFKKRRVSGARRLFVVGFLHSPRGTPLFYDPAVHRMVEPDWSPELRAIHASIAPWEVLSKKGAPVGAMVLTVDERDPDYRIILNPITDDRDRIVGVAGMVVDQAHFATELLPGAVARSLPHFFDQEAATPVVIVRDHAGRLVYASGRLPDAHAAPVDGDSAKTLPFVFTNWRMELHSGAASPEKVARASFVLNLTLALVIGLGLLAGVVLALRTAARAVYLSQMKTDFVSNVSHELRTPLASIRVFGELLSLGKAAEPDKVREYGTRIEAESRRLTGLINNILDFSRIDSGRKIYDFERADVTDVVHGVLEAFEPRFKRRGFTVQLAEPSGPVGPVRVDVAALSQVLHNLLDNAIKYSGDSREVEVGVERRGPWVAVSVTDHGVGIAPKEQRRIFERFHRVSTGLVHDVKGSGLGLALVDQIVRAHGGRVELESEPGRGSTFTVLLPVPEAAAETTAGARADRVRRDGAASEVAPEPGRA